VQPAQDNNNSRSSSSSSSSSSTEHNETQCARQPTAHQLQVKPLDNLQRQLMMLLKSSLPPANTQTSEKRSMPVAKPSRLNRSLRASCRNLGNFAGSWYCVPNRSALPEGSPRATGSMNCTGSQQGWVQLLAGHQWQMVPVSHLDVSRTFLSLNFCCNAHDAVSSLHCGCAVDELHRCTSVVRLQDKGQDDVLQHAAAIVSHAFLWRSSLAAHRGPCHRCIRP